MINFLTEETISMAEVSELFAARLGGRKVSRRTIFKWYAKGLRGVKLETVIVAGERRTTPRAVAEFCAAIPRAGIGGRQPRESTPLASTAAAGAGAACEDAGR